MLAKVAYALLAIGYVACVVAESAQLPRVYWEKAHPPLTFATVEGFTVLCKTPWWGYYAHGEGGALVMPVLDCTA